MESEPTKDFLFVSSRLGRGGAEKHLLRLINELSAGDSKIQLFLTQKNGDYERFLDSSVKITYLSNINSSYFLSILFSIFSLAKILKSNNHPHIIAIQDGPKMLTLLSKYLIRSSVGVYGWVQNNPEHMASAASTLPYFWSVKLLYSRLKVLISLSEGVATKYLELCPKLNGKVLIINNIGYPEKSNVSDNKAIYQLDKSKINLVACGRLTPQKNYFMMLNALKMAISQNEKLFLTIIGDGEQEKSIFDYIISEGLEHHVKLLGFINYPELVIKQSSIFLLSSDFEGFGNVIVEAMAMGIPVIATDCPYGPSEIIEQNLNGILVPVGDSETMAKQIIE